MNNIFINGQWITGEGKAFESFSPTDSNSNWHGNSASEKQVKRAVEAAHNSQFSWAAMGLEKRIAIIECFAELLKQHHSELAEIISRETGKPLWESTTEVTAMANKIAISIDAQQERTGELATLAHRPHGVFSVFGPYNFPGHLPNGHIVPALLAGNTIVFKPSEETPLTAEKTVELWIEAGIPCGVINLIQGGVETGKALANADINGLLFTGSSKTGALLHKQFADRPECLLALEMGGNNPLIVSDVNNIDIAVWHIINSAFISAGQRCTCARRLILVNSHKTDELIEHLTAAIERITFGHWQDDVFMGPVINRNTAIALRAAEQHMQQLGGKSLLSFDRDSGNDTQSKECYLPPALIDMSRAAEIPDEEWFGPLLQLYRVNSFEEAIELANDTRFGLAAGLLSDTGSEQELFINTIKAGVVSLNKPTAGASSALPFGGVGASGNHRPSAYYAADYCAWPQAISRGTDTNEQSLSLPKGIKP
ncbi:MAG: succinylglutamate-semialdehyde dehydrogenase [Cellvibrionaceae bacterium]